MKELESVARSATERTYQFNSDEINESELRTYLETDYQTLEEHYPHDASSDICHLWVEEEAILVDCIMELTQKNSQKDFDSALQALKEKYPVILKKYNQTK